MQQPEYRYSSNIYHILNPCPNLPSLPVLYPIANALPIRTAQSKPKLAHQDQNDHQSRTENQHKGRNSREAPSSACSTASSSTFLRKATPSSLLSVNLASASGPSPAAPLLGDGVTGMPTEMLASISAPPPLSPLFTPSSSPSSFLTPSHSRCPTPVARREFLPSPLIPPEVHLHHASMTCPPSPVSMYSSHSQTHSHSRFHSRSNSRTRPPPPRSVFSEPVLPSSTEISRTPPLPVTRARSEPGESKMAHDLTFIQEFPYAPASSKPPPPSYFSELPFPTYPPHGLQFVPYTFIDAKDYLPSPVLDHAYPHHPGGSHATSTTITNKVGSTSFSSSPSFSSPTTLPPFPAHVPSSSVHAPISFSRSPSALSHCSMDPLSTPPPLPAFPNLSVGSSLPSTAPPSVSSSTAHPPLPTGVPSSLGMLPPSIFHASSSSIIPTHRRRRAINPTKAARRGESWTKEDIAILDMGLKLKKTWKQIGDKLERSPEAARAFNRMSRRLVGELEDEDGSAQKAAEAAWSEE